MSVLVVIAVADALRAVGWLGVWGPWLAGTGLALLLAILAGWAVARGRRRRRKKLLAPYEEFSRRLVSLLDEIEALTKRHELLPFSDPDFEQPMSGATEQSYQQAEQDIRSARRQWLEMMGVYEQIRLMAESGRRLGREQARTIQDLMQAAQHVAPTESLLARGRERLDRLEHAHEQAAPLRAEANRIREAVEARVAQLQEAGLSTVPYMEEVAAGLDGLGRGHALLTADPLGATAALQAARDGLQEAGRRLDEVWAQHERLQALHQALEETAQVAGERRAAGLRLVEKGGNPDPMLAQARQEADAAAMAIDRGETAEALGYLEEGETWRERAVDAMRRQENARAFCAQAIAARTQRDEEIRGMLGRAAAELEQLAQRYAEGSWRSVARHAEQAEKILDAGRPLLTQAAAAASEAEQRYFHAEDVLVHLEQQQEQAAGLMQAISERGRELAAQREACETLQRSWDDRMDQLERSVSDHREVLSPEVQQLLQSARSLRDQVHDQLDAPRPHWPMARQHLEQALRAVEEALDQVEDELRAHEAFVAKLARTEQAAGEVERFLAAHQADRPRANEAFRAARQHLADTRARSRTSVVEWRSLEEELTRIGEDIERARDWARMDIDLARDAEQAVARAEQDLQRAGGFYELGVSAPVRGPERLVQQARRAIRRQEYEAALDGATQAANGARVALEQAQRQVRDKRRAIARQRMAQVATTVVQAAAAYYGARQGSRPRRHGRTPPLSTRPTFPSRSWHRR